MLDSLLATGEGVIALSTSQRRSTPRFTGKTGGVDIRHLEVSERFWFRYSIREN